MLAVRARLITVRWCCVIIIVTLFSGCCSQSHLNEAVAISLCKMLWGSVPASFRLSFFFIFSSRVASRPFVCHKLSHEIHLWVSGVLLATHWVCQRFWCILTFSVVNIANPQTLKFHWLKKSVSFMRVQAIGPLWILNGQNLWVFGPADTAMFKKSLSLWSEAFSSV